MSHLSSHFSERIRPDEYFSDLGVAEQLMNPSDQFIHAIGLAEHRHSSSQVAAKLFRLWTAGRKDHLGVRSVLAGEIAEFDAIHAIRQLHVAEQQIDMRTAAQHIDRLDRKSVV